MIDLTSLQLQQVREILEQYVPDTEVWVFGSRINNTARSFSDLDLVIIGQKKIPQMKYYQLKDAFEESELNIKVDVLDWHRISPEFKENIKSKYEIIYSAGKSIEKSAEKRGQTRHT